MAQSRRSVHPIAWWIWALALGASALRTTNSLLLGLLVGSAWFVVAARRPAAPWARSFGSFLRLGVAIIILHMVFQAICKTDHNAFRVLWLWVRASFPCLSKSALCSLTLLSRPSSSRTSIR